MRKEFINEVIKRVSTIYPDATVTINEVTKNNGLIRHGLTIMEKNMTVAPTIYLEPFYDSNADMKNIVKEICDIYEKNKPNAVQADSIKMIMNYENVKDKIAFKIVNAKKNAELLEKIPHVDFLDLSIIFYILLNKNGNGISSTLIHNNMIKSWNVNTNTLLKQATWNMPKLLPSELCSLSSIVAEFIPNVDDSESPVQMYVLTNADKLYGACTILYPDVLKKTAEKLKSDLYVLPSSVHEVIILPATDENVPSELTELVKDVNQTQVADDEILSDNVYFYSKEHENLTLCS